MKSDTIYRQDAIEAVDNACRDWRGTFRRCEDALKALPSAEPDVITMRVNIDKEAWKQALANSPLTVFPAEKDGWIPVTERLPEEYQKAICTDKDNKMMIGTYTKYGWMFPCYFETPIAWMPLPEPYTED